MVWYDPPEEGKQYIRYAKMGLSEIPVSVGGRITFEDGTQIGTGSPRMTLLWERKELICSICGIAAGFAAIEAHLDTPEAKHLNFYSYDFSGKEVMLTWDHVIPKSKSGTNFQNNAQCLCEICNGMKGNDDNKPSSVQVKRKAKGMPIKYLYLADGSRIFQWTKKQWSTTLNGDSNNT